jgi:hypothetical protein
MSKRDVLQFECAVVQVKTTVDGGIHVTLSIPPELTQIAKTLMDCKRNELTLGVAAAVLKNRQEQDAVSKGKNQQSKWKTAEE